MFEHIEDVKMCSLLCYGLRGKIFAKDKRVRNAKRTAIASCFTHHTHAIYATVSLPIVVIYGAGNSVISLAS